MAAVDENITIDVIKSRTVKGVAVLTGRTFFLQVISQVAIFLLTIFLSPAQFGTFFIVSAVVNFLSFFSDVGLAAALIQKKEKLDSIELKTTFTLQQAIVISLVVLVFIFTPLVKDWYGLEPAAVYLLWALALSLFFSSLKTIPSVLLERKLDFNKLVIPQLVESLLYNLVVVYLAWQGFGIMSFTIAVLIRGISGLVILYMLQPWMPGLAFSSAALSRLLKFGLPYQLNSFLAVAKDDGMTILLGGILGPSGMGLLGWAQKWAAAPLRFFMDQVIRVTFPAFSRLQNEKVQLSYFVSKSIFYICLFVYPMIVGLILLSPLLVSIIPKYEKWQPALLALFLISINTAWAAVSTPLTNMLNAIGKITITFKLMIMWTILTWAMVPALSVLYGVGGAALGFALVGFSSIVAIFVASKFATIDFISSVFKPLLAALIMGLGLIFVRSLLSETFLSAIILICFGIVVYWFSIILLIGPAVFNDLKSIFDLLKNKKSEN